MFRKIILKLIQDPAGLFKVLLFRIKLFYKWFLAFYIKKNREVIERTHWYRNKGDDYLRLRYKLNEESIVFDVGGYVGNFSESILKKFGCKVFLFEPSSFFYKECLKRFNNNRNISCFNYGLGCLNGTFILSNDNEASSVERKINQDKGEKIKIKKISEIIKELNVKSIDLMKINIEGGEYDLLTCLINENLISKINNIQVQFHSFVPNAEKKRENIINSLKKTHKNDWSYFFVWESWSLK